MSRPEALRRATALRESLRATGQVFTQQRFHELLLASCQNLKRSALEGLVAWAATEVDRRSTHAAEEEGSLFPLEGDYKLDEGNRIGKAAARIEHMEAAIQLKRKNAAAVNNALARDEAELENLRPYLVNGVSKREAVAAYQADHPDQAIA